MLTSTQVSLQRRPHFFKIFFPQLCGQKLGIPPKFWRHLEDRIHGVVSLKGQSGEVWNAELVRDANGISFQNGWQDFVRDHSISLKDVLLFRYDGYLEFSVFVFGNNACEKEDAYLASSCQEISIVRDSSVKERALVCLNDDICDPISPIREMVIFDTSKRPALCSSTKRKSTSTCGSPGIRHNVSENGMKPPVSVVKEEPIEILEPSTPTKTTQPSDKKRKYTKRREEETRPLSMEPITSARRKAETRPSLVKPITSCSSTRKKTHTYAVRLKERWSTLNYENGQAVVKARMGILISNRRPVTEDELWKASEAARLFISKNPTTLVIMKESYVYQGFYLNFPADFVREYLPKSTQEMKLLDPSGKVWTVNYIVYLGRGGISAHWGAFSLANNLEKGDVCVFELIARAAMKVHIFRVVDKLTPPTHVASNFKALSPYLMLEDRGKRH